MVNCHLLIGKWATNKIMKMLLHKTKSEYPQKALTPAGLIPTKTDENIRFNKE